MPSGATFKHNKFLLFVDVIEVKIVQTKDLITKRYKII